MYYICTICAKKYPLHTTEYCCQCGGIFECNYNENEIKKISIGEVKTPITEYIINGRIVKLKLEYYSPSGSFKDRGAREIISLYKSLNVKEIYEDSSGNAGAAISAYSAAAGIKCNIYLPEDTPSAKIKQIKAYGSKVVKVPGDRDNTSKAILNDVKDNYYASHVYNPIFFEGVSSIVNEIENQVDTPDYIFAPVGNGTLALGLYYGYRKLGFFPKFIFVQAQNCSPIYANYKNKIITDKLSTIADGISIGNPKRINEIISAVYKSKGNIITVSEDEIINELISLHKAGIYCEPSSAVAVAGARKYNLDISAKVLIPITGSGLKK